MSEKTDESDSARMRAEVEGLLGEIKQLRVQAEEQLKAAEAARKKADEDATYAYQAKVNSEEHSKATAVFKGAAEAELSAITTNKRNFEELVAAVTIGKAAVEADMRTISEVLKTVNADKATVSEILAHLEKSDQKALGYEETVDGLAKKLGELNKQAEGFLPGATSAGLAHAFNAQKGRFSEPQKRWLRTFVGCIVGLVVVAAPNFYTAVFGNIYGIKLDSSWEEIFRGMAMRLPIVIPLVWLAIYAGRNYMISLRIEEEYAYKEALSRAFEGYKREMKDIGAGEVGNPTPLNKFCLNILSALAERPGRIYEGHQKDITLLAEALEVADKMDELRKRKISAS